MSLPDTETRNRVLTRLREQERVLLLGCGRRSIRFRPALTVLPADLEAGVAALDRVLSEEKL
jgi:L-lysine 6-transaminase